MTEKPLVQNAGDPKQVEEARKTQQFRREDELNDLRYLLSQPQFRRFVWRMIKFCRVFESIWHQSAQIHYNSGQQDVGHFITAEIVEAEPNALISMMQENKKEK